ncbi:hypothetical protein GF323_05595 [Candidatus Woesearchaeota archaeon]|nr:hypothetical protein [Candidatus Woesearchaeota archaeon]
MEKTLEITGIRDETHDVKTFRLKSDEKIGFIPGQYALFSFADKEDFENEARPFTFANSPTVKDYIEITVKKMGKFTSALHSSRKGDKLKLSGPGGESLNFDENIKDDVVFIAGGSGITPFMSSLRYAAAKGLANNFTLLFSNRAKDDIIYHKELGEMNERGNMKVVHTLTKKAPKDWNGEQGRINADMIKKHVDSPKGRLWYICAPPPMVHAMEKILKDMDIPEEKLKFEDWQIKGKHD